MNREANIIPIDLTVEKHRHYDYALIEAVKVSQSLANFVGVLRCRTVYYSGKTAFVSKNVPENCGLVLGLEDAERPVWPLEARNNFQGRMKIGKFH